MVLRTNVFHPTELIGQNGSHDFGYQHARNASKNPYLIHRTQPNIILCFPSVPRLVQWYHGGMPVYARRTAPTTAIPATTMDAPKELADPVKGVIGELLGSGPEALQGI